MDMGLGQAVALVTGGGRGIGTAIAAGLAREGCSVAVCDKDVAAAQDVARTITSAGGVAKAFELDVTSAESVRDALRAVERDLGRTGILVNNAGFSLDAPLDEMSEEQWDRVVDACLKGTWLMCRAAAPAMKAAGHGRIVNIASRAHLGENNKSNYCAAKAGVVGLTNALSIELAPHGVTVNAVAPGLIRTERVLGLRYFEDIDRRARAATPVQRPGLPEDIAAAVVFLASRHAGFISGETLHVTGGRYSST